MRRLLTAVMVALIATLGSASAALAQHGGARDGSGPLLDASKTVVVQGDVVRFQAGPGQGAPELVVREASGAERSFLLGPYRALRAQGFAADAGDRVEVTAFACASCPAGAAVERVTNLSRGITLVVRNADGSPAWSARRGSARGRPVGVGGSLGAIQGGAAGAPAWNGRGPGSRRAACGGAGPDLTRTTTFGGTVTSFRGGRGEGVPTVVLATPTGEVSIVLAPYRALAASGYTPADGDRLEVAAAPVNLGGGEQWVALSVRNAATGLEIVLRDPVTGRPL
jgi:hypothetical protein